MASCSSLEVVSLPFCSCAKAETVNRPIRPKLKIGRFIFISIVDFWVLSSSSLDTQRYSTFGIEDFLLFACTKSGWLNVDLDLFDGAGVGEWRLVVLAHG